MTLRLCRGSTGPGGVLVVDGFRYRVRTGSFNGTVTVDVLKRYNWGNVAGGEHKNNVGPGSFITELELVMS